MSRIEGDGCGLRIVTAVETPFDLPAVLLFDIDQVPEAMLPRPRIEETGAALQRYPKPEQAKNAARHVRRRQVLRMLASQCSGRPASRISVDRTPSGALRVNPHSLGLHASLSHRGSLTAFGFAAQPIGVDIEPDRPVDSLPLALLHVEEQRFLEALPETSRSFTFLKLWTLKEACVKAIGTGFETPLESFAIAFSGTDAPPRISGLPAAVQLCHRIIVDGIYGAIHVAAARLVPVMTD